MYDNEAPHGFMESVKTECQVREMWSVEALAEVLKLQTKA